MAKGKAVKPGSVVRKGHAKAAASAPVMAEPVLPAPPPSDKITEISARIRILKEEVDDLENSNPELEQLDKLEEICVELLQIIVQRRRNLSKKT